VSWIYKGPLYLLFVVIGQHMVRTCLRNLKRHSSIVKIGRGSYVNSVWQLIAEDSTRSYADASDCDTVTTTFRRWRKCLTVPIGLCLAESYETTSMCYSITCQNFWQVNSVAQYYMRPRQHNKQLLSKTTELNNVTILCGKILWQPIPELAALEF